MKEKINRKEGRKEEGKNEGRKEGKKKKDLRKKSMFKVLKKKPGRNAVVCALQAECLSGMNFLGSGSGPVTAGSRLQSESLLPHP